MKKLVEYTRFYTWDGELLGEQIDDGSCSPYAGGDYNGHCGGCYTCLMMQVAHSGFDGVQVSGETYLEC
jgi:7-cyano-7-deazaguanine synthase in queuosine biosynthesis